MTTVAPTMPVLAASRAPTMTTASARPPRRPPIRAVRLGQQIFRNARALEGDAHKHKQRHGDECLVGDNAEQAAGQKAEIVEREVPAGGADKGHEQANACQRQRHRVARQQ